MEIAIKEDPVGVTLTFDGWTNVKNEQLLGTVILSSEGKPYVWKAVDISSERKNYTAVIEKTEAMLTELKNKEITVCAIFFKALQFSKVLQMSKLRADITYGHRLHNNPILIESTLDIDDANETDTNQNPGNLNGLENNRSNDPAVNLETNFKPIEVDYDSDDEAFEL
uniref:DUF659 domain-containing protein n=1 Tax=Rhizophagus irregularis (strain DAOM 181602 / DAOM 197198 / MUCL 43194) TaxID=747089 RepID=U9TB46_RHIID